MEKEKEGDVEEEEEGDVKEDMDMEECEEGALREGGLGEEVWWKRGVERGIF